MPKAFDFPVWLQGTSEQQKAEAERQALALAAHGRGHLTETERLVSRGALLEATARGNLDVKKSKDQAARVLAESQLADALAMQGKFTEAAKTHPDRARRKHFQNIVKAIQKPDDQKCKCKDSLAKMNDVDLSITPRFEVTQVVSPVHGELVSLVQCSKCGHLNARPLRSRLLKHNAAQNQSERVGKPVMNDSQILNARAIDHNLF